MQKLLTVDELTCSLKIKSLRLDGEVFNRPTMASDLADHLEASGRCGPVSAIGMTEAFETLMFVSLDGGCRWQMLHTETEKTTVLLGKAA